MDETELNESKRQLKELLTSIKNVLTDLKDKKTGTSAMCSVKDSVNKLRNLCKK